MKIFSVSRSWYNSSSENTKKRAKFSKFRRRRTKEIEQRNEKSRYIKMISGEVGKSRTDFWKVTILNVLESSRKITGDSVLIIRLQTHFLEQDFHQRWYSKYPFRRIPEAHSEAIQTLMMELSSEIFFFRKKNPIIVIWQSPEDFELVDVSFSWLGICMFLSR